MARLRGIVRGTEKQPISAREESSHEVLETARAEAKRIVEEAEAKARSIVGSAEEARLTIARETKAIEDAARDEADKRAKRILGIAIQRFASAQAEERATTTVHLASDELKGRVIGREGRNIRALAEATGVDFVIDDTERVIVISGFDPMRREIGRVTLEKLLADGRIHPTRIQEVVELARNEVRAATLETADRALEDLGISGVARELREPLGELRLRYSYAQNVLRHAIEVAHLSGTMASEIGLDPRVARRAGVLHDIGKAVSHEVEGGHAVIGGRLARAHGEAEIVANAIASHHGDEAQESVYASLVAAADALSSARPGARRAELEGYVHRLEDLERIANAFVGVEKSYAIQAGREVRVIVEPSEVTDEESALLARAIAQRIERDLLYPGQVRVTVVRETRAVDYAK